MNNLALFDFCESCGNGHIATHVVDFRDLGPEFLTCRSCAEEAKDRGLAVVNRIDGLHYQDDSVTLYHGDCLDVLGDIGDSSVDAIVTDPPYGLGFMGKAWDDLPPGEEWARECLRVLKPGGHLLAFDGTRTWHRLACAVEDAGFEMRDSIAWLYGSGFPKSLDVSKAIDKRRTEDAEPVRVICRAVRAALDVRDLKSRHIVEHFDGCHPRLIDHWAARDTDSQPSLPTWEQWETLCSLFPELAEHDAEAWRLNGRKGTPGEAWQTAEVTGTARGVDTTTSRLGFAGATYGGTSAAADYELRAANSEAAEQWQGWGTALKPAFEPVVVARKPLVGTVAANVLTHGTGALNIDGCRVGREEGDRTEYGRERHLPHANTTASLGTFNEVTPYEPHTAGRWPANVVLDESQADALDQQSGTTRSPDGVGRHPSRQRTTMSGGILGAQPEGSKGFGDSGGASRFFYVAKAPKRERPRTEDGQAHPTVKPLTLMCWLVRLVTPPGGTVLDPFAGSGTTVEACILEGFDCIAIEREAEYLPLIEARIARSSLTEGDAS